MEYGDSGIIALEDGWFLETKTGNTIDPVGRVYDKTGELIYDPTIEEYDV